MTSPSSLLGMPELLADGDPPPNGHDAIEAAIDESQPVGFSCIELWLTHFKHSGSDDLETRMEGRWIGLLANNPLGIVQSLRAQADIIEKQFGLKGPQIAIARDLPR